MSLHSGKCSRHWNLVAFVLAAGVFGFTGRSLGVDDEFESWLRRETNAARSKMFENIWPADSQRGVVIASPQRRDPDYYYHWVRDAGLVMHLVANLYADEQNAEEKLRLFHSLSDFARFSRANQTTPTPSGHLGEPKFHVDGRAFEGPWGRPQNDGPAIRAIALTRFAQELLDEGRRELVEASLYDKRQPTESVIKADLEFVSHHWRETCFDVWEEIRGQHFFTVILQRRSLLDGADLASRLGDEGAANWYRRQAREMEDVLAQFWDARQGVIVPTRHRDGGIDYKTSNLDSQVIIGALHGDRGDGYFAVANDAVLSTAARISAEFKNLYRLNRDTSHLGVAIGRYPEDRYDGGNFQGGHPWFLATAAFAELKYRAAKAFAAQNRIAITDTNIHFVRDVAPDMRLSSGDTFRAGDAEFSRLLSALHVSGDRDMQRIRRHTDGEGSLSEQFDRDSGYMRSARDLTWSYAAYLTAVRARQAL